jgi:nitrogenase molybdenum-cofactor synthesis protein NifE
MGILWTLASIREAALVEFGSMGHMVYARVALERAGIHDACTLHATHISDTDITFGTTTRLMDAVQDIIGRDQPKTIFLLPSSVPEMIGADLKQLAAELRELHPNTRILAFECGGFHEDGTKGLEEALTVLAREMPLLDMALDKDKPVYNIIGTCADQFRFQADAAELERMMLGAFGMKPQCIMTSGASVESLEGMGRAAVNVIIRREGIPAAEHLQKAFGTPYVYGRPYGIQGTCAWLEQIGEVLGKKPNSLFMADEAGQARKGKELLSQLARFFKDRARLMIGGHADVVEGILAFACGELGIARGTSWCSSSWMAGKELPYYTEKQWMEAVQADPQGILMASGDILEWSGRPGSLQIANPDLEWRINPYVPPFMGFRGALNLMELWIHEIMRKS